eukprot:2938568-Rhodomonas_salina.1
MQRNLQSWILCQSEIQHTGQQLPGILHPQEQQRPLVSGDVAAVAARRLWRGAARLRSAPLPSLLASSVESNGFDLRNAPHVHPPHPTGDDLESGGVQSLARHKKDTRLSPSLQVSIISGLFFILSVDRGSIPQLLRLLQKEHSFSASHLGLLGGANYIGRAIGSPACTVVSILRPRSEIKIIAACVMLWTLGMMITGLLFSLVSCPLFAHICNDMHIAEISHCNTREWVTLCYSSSHASSPGQ